MKLFTPLVILSALLTGCGGEQKTSSNSPSSTPPAATREVETTPIQSPSPTVAPSLAAKDTERPVEFTYLGLTPGKDAIAYKIKVNSAKPISQVDLSVKYMEASGKVLEETTIAWQNIVKSTRQPIESGKTYEAEGYLPEGATKAECSLKRVVFADGTYWNER
jgi:hypothetical protein